MKNGCVRRVENKTGDENALQCKYVINKRLFFFNFFFYTETTNGIVFRAGSRTVGELLQPQCVQLRKNRFENVNEPAICCGRQRSNELPMDNDDFRVLSSLTYIFKATINHFQIDSVGRIIMSCFDEKIFKMVLGAKKKKKIITQRFSRFVECITVGVTNRIFYC